MAKMFSTKTHGVLDYLTVGQLLTLPRMLGWSDNVTQWTTAMAMGTLVNSLVTRYEYGPLKLQPMKGHLMNDMLQGALFCAAPWIFPNEDTTVKATLVGMGLFEIVTALSTETEPSYNERLSQFGDSISDSVQDTTNTLSERTVGA